MLVPILFVWGRVAYGLLRGLWSEFITNGKKKAVDPGLALLREVGALSPQEAREQAERALASGRLAVEPATGVPGWCDGLDPELIAFFRRYNRVAVPGVSALGGSAAGAAAFLPGHRVLGPANAEGDRWWVVAPGSHALVLSEESALDAHPLGRLPGLNFVLVWMDRMALATQGGS